METIVVETGPTRQLRREHAKTMYHGKLTESNGFESPSETGNQDKSDGSGIEEVTDAVAMAPGAPRPSRTVIHRQPKNRMVLTRNGAPTTNVAKQLAAAATAPNQLATEKVNTATNVQIKQLTDLVTVLLKAMEEQKQAQARAMKEQKQVQVNQIETLTRMFNQQIETLKAEVVKLIQAQLSNIQALPSATPSYADIARTSPGSQPSNLLSFSSMNTTPSIMTDTLYCTVDTSRAEEDNRSMVQPGAIRGAIEKDMRTMEGHDGWRCIAVVKDPKNTARIRVTCRDEAELQHVKAAAQKTSAPGARVL